MKKISILILFFIFVLPSYLLAIGNCDTNNLRSCSLRSLNFDRSSGNGAQYVEIEKTNSQTSIRNAIAIEMWMRPTKQPGTKKFIAGLWGPSEEQNDVWVLYFDATDSLVFELNGPNTNLRQEDNTIVKASIDGLWGTYFHVAAVFDGATNTSKIYINGKVVASTSNLNYPLNQLRSLNNQNLPIQLGGTNAFTNDLSNYRTYLGLIDEFRVWNRALDSATITCNLDLSLNGDETGLIIYYRCNELTTTSFLCDATGNGNIGIIRSGANCRTPGRPDRTPIKVLSKPTFADTVRCKTTKDYQITIIDTSDCPSTRAQLYIHELTEQGLRVTNLGSPIPNGLVALNSNTPTTFTVRMNINWVGTKTFRFLIVRNNFCGYQIYNESTAKITRLTEIDADIDSLKFQELKANCVEEPYRELKFNICNSSTVLKTINNISTQFSSVYRVMSPSVPFSLNPNECREIVLRFYSADSAQIYNDNLSIFSDDICQPKRDIPITGEVKDVISLFRGNATIDTMNFGNSCINVPSVAQIYYWRNNLQNETIQVINIKMPTHFGGNNLGMPFELRPNTGYRENYLVFVPKVKGQFLDSVIYTIRSGGCTIIKKIYVKGRGLDPDVKFTINNFDFGNIVVGKEGSGQMEVENISEEQLNVQFFFKRGEVFYFPGGRTFPLSPGQKRSVQVNFRPTSDTAYIDQLCFIELACNKSQCIPISGNGILEEFEFIPEIMETKNVIACRDSIGMVEIKNISNSTLEVSNFILDDPSGKFTPTNPDLVTLNNLNTTIDPNQSLKFEFLYDPNDVLQEQANRAFLRYETSDGQKWAVTLFGTSIIPKLTMIDEIQFGTLEQNEVRVQTVILENLTDSEILIDSVEYTGGLGFRIIDPIGYIGRTLSNGDTIRLNVEFNPTQPIAYSGKIKVWASQPCNVSITSDLSGFAQVLPMEVPQQAISFGFVKPCDCFERSMQLTNLSKVFPADIDSVIINDFGLIDKGAEYFTWFSNYSPLGIYPYQIPPFTRDTLKIKYCPRQPANRDSIQNSSLVNIYAKGQGWSNNFERFISGNRMLIIEPVPWRIDFPSTRVDTFATTRFAEIKIPGIDVNPAREDITIDSVTFVPNDRVFYVVDSLLNTFPLTIKSIDSLTLKVDFKPRAARNYEAKMYIHVSTPCPHIDSTIIVTGSGFAPAFGLSFNVGDWQAPIDTVYSVYCDTLKIPIYTDRNIPGNVVDIEFDFIFDTTKFDLIGIESYYLDNQCNNFPSKYEIFPTDTSGYNIQLSNFCSISNNRPILLILLKSKPGILRTTSFVAIDSISFDTQNVVLYKIIANSDLANTRILEASVQSSNSINFNNLEVLRCLNDTLMFVNTGEVPIKFSDLIITPTDFTLVNVTPNSNTFIQLGDTIYTVIQFCPLSKNTFTSSAKLLIEPCELFDTTSITGVGITPPFEIKAGLDLDFTNQDTLYGIFNQYLTVPLFFSDSIFVNYDSIIYWLTNVNMDLKVSYNPTALKYLGFENFSTANIDSINSNGNLNFTFNGIDSIKNNHFANLYFNVVVPDSIVSNFDIILDNFSSNGIYFLDLFSIIETGRFNSSGECNISTMQFSKYKTTLSQNAPNPFTFSTKISFEVMEIAPVKIVLYDIQGNIVVTIFNSINNLLPGKYEVIFDNTMLNSGSYYYKLESGSFITSKSLQIIK